ncbi:hypothetical protein [Pseudomonas sp. TSRC2-2]|uniref:hypothetical protein n=1 Tax=Pseudomonas sp. TSRC2-2 TaxID=2804571 RepID=UPI003CF32E08
MKDLLVSLARNVKPGLSIIAAALVFYSLFQILLPTFKALLLVYGLALLFGFLMIVQGVGQWVITWFDSGTKRAGFKARCNHLWSMAPQLHDHTHDGVMQDLMIQPLPDDFSGQCWAFGIDTSGYPGYEAVGYLLVEDSMLHLAVVAGGRGKWHIESYCRATCTVNGSVFTIQSICGPLTGWVGSGSMLGFSLDQAGDEGVRGGPFGYVRISKCGVPRVLHRFSNLVQRSC